jgi:hypothetical protein
MNGYCPECEVPIARGQCATHPELALIPTLVWRSGWFLLTVDGRLVGGFPERLVAVAVLSTQPSGTRYTIAYYNREYLR